ncbi:hypothetical protein B0J11DRAFT_246811 [Dendryphion nanum]|uniref:Uncharacterized protein n=1 Tax=Dendryphion nanum TaxID=256645 RepID=A0A9P9E0Z0_9PLEO|nr:hypothetical protein B0J11DRAFT_246811 [Dendryphion nanum]
MQEQQLPSFPAAEGSGRSSMEENSAGKQKSQTEDWVKSSVQFLPLPTSFNDSETSPPPSPAPPKPEKRARKAAPSPLGPYLQSMPTIETILDSPNLTRPTYNTLVRGNPPAQSYKTVIHVPKPPSLRTLDQNMLHSAEVQAFRRRKRSYSNLRSRSSTVSSTASEVSGCSAGATSSIAEEGECESSNSETSDPDSPKSCDATVTSSLPGSPLDSFYPLLDSSASTQYSSTTSSRMNSANASIESFIINSYANSSAESFHSTQSAISLSNSTSRVGNTLCSVSESPSLPFPPLHTLGNEAYPSPPTSPTTRRSSSSGEEYMAYPSPPPSPRGMPLLHPPQPRNRERRAFTFPALQPQPQPEQNLAAPSTSSRSSSSSSSTSKRSRPILPPRISRSTSLSSHPYLSLRRVSSNSNTDPDSDSKSTTTAGLINLDYAIPYSGDIGEQCLGGGGLDSDTEADEDNWDMDFDWSMNGGKIIFGTNGAAVNHNVKVVVEAEATAGSSEGSACAPRLGSGGRSRSGSGRSSQLELYVIDEEDDDDD